MLELDRVGAADFSPHLHDRFRVAIGRGVSGELELVEVHDTGRTSTTRKQSPFSLLFKGTRDNLLPQQLYRIENETLGPMELFLVPGREDQEGYYYEAVFN